jgi:hypothetical protein
MAAIARLALFCVVLVALLALDECKYISLIIIASIYLFSLFLLDLSKYVRTVTTYIIQLYSLNICDIIRQPNWWLWQQCRRFGWEQTKHIPFCKLKTCPGATDGDQCWCCVLDTDDHDCYSQDIEQAEQKCKDGCHPPIADETPWICYGSPSTRVGEWMSIMKISFTNHPQLFAWIYFLLFVSFTVLPFLFGFCYWGA